MCVFSDPLHCGLRHSADAQLLAGWSIHRYALPLPCQYLNDMCIHKTEGKCHVYYIAETMIVCTNLYWSKSRQNIMLKKSLFKSMSQYIHFIAHSGNASPMIDHVLYFVALNSLWSRTSKMAISLFYGLTLWWHPTVFIARDGGKICCNMLPWFAITSKPIFTNWGQCGNPDNMENPRH